MSQFRFQGALHALNRGGHNGPLDPALFQCLQLAAFAAFRIAALVVVVYVTGTTLAAFTDEHGTTLATEQLGRQQIFFFCLGMGRCMLVGLQLLLNTVELFFINDDRQLVRDYDGAVVILTLKKQLISVGIVATHESFERGLGRTFSKVLPSVLKTSRSVRASWR